MRKRDFLLIGLAWLVFLPAGPTLAQPAPEVIRVDADAPTRPFPHFWERMFGSGRANLTLRASWRDDLRAVREITDCGYVRFHGILDDHNGVYAEAKDGKPVYNWSYVDQIYDGVLAAGVRPFVELSFMPSALAVSQKPHPFWYKPLPNPPKSYERWGELVGALTRHLVERYGAEEVRRWYFEVWNEPNIDFWTGKPAQETYFRLYESAARAVRAVDGRLRVGGPATAQAAWVGDFIRHCVEKDIPLDFVTTHVYGNDTAKDVLHREEKVPPHGMVTLAVRKVHDEVKASPRPGLPIIWSEYNATYMNQAEVTDSAFMGPWLANTIRECDGMVDMLAYWCLSDVFEEQGVVKKPFYGGYGLIASGNIPKAAFNAFAMLHRLGDHRLSPELENALVTKRDDGTLAIAIWHDVEPGAAGPAREFEIHINRGRSASVTILDEGHGSALSAWRAMGAPAFPGRDQQRALRAAARLPESEVKPIRDGALTLKLAPHGLALIEVRP